MTSQDPAVLLIKKQGLVESAVVLSMDENKLIKSKKFEKAAPVDAEKSAVINSLVSCDRELAAAMKPGVIISENAKEIIKNINSSLNELIKLEKENELLISQAGESISGKYIDSYKTYKQLK